MTSIGDREMALSVKAGLAAAGARLAWSALTARTDTAVLPIEGYGISRDFGAP
jgi:hypothetical protein